MATIKAKKRGSKASPSLPPPPRERKADIFSTLEEIVSGKQSPIDVKNLAHIFMERAGGQQGFVELVWAEYHGSDMGSLARSRVLEIMMKLFQLATPKEDFGDYGDFTDDDLKKVVSKHVIAPPPQLLWVDHVCI